MKTRRSSKPVKKPSAPIKSTCLSASSGKVDLKPERPVALLCPRALHVCARFSQDAMGKAADIIGDRVYVEIDRHGALYVGCNAAALFVVRVQHPFRINGTTQFVNEITGKYVLPAHVCLFDEDVLRQDLGDQSFLRLIENNDSTLSLAGWDRSIFHPLKGDHIDWRSNLDSVADPVAIKADAPPIFDYSLLAKFTLAHQLIPEVGAPMVLPSPPKQAARVVFTKGMAVGVVMPTNDEYVKHPFPPSWSKSLLPVEPAKVRFKHVTEAELAGERKTPTAKLRRR
jgi:hypothetical protein